MKLNKLQRHTAYIIMLDIAENREEYLVGGLCDIYQEIFGELPYCIRGYRGSKHGFDFHLPELWKKRTTNDWCAVWYYGDEKYTWRSRKRLLKQCIEETS